MNPVSELAIRAVPDLRTGGVIINGSSTWRAYGGVKDSGVGREGPRYSIRDMTGGAWCFSTNWSVFERIGHRFA